MYLFHIQSFSKGEQSKNSDTRNLHGRAVLCRIIHVYKQHMDARTHIHCRTSWIHLFRCSDFVMTVVCMVCVFGVYLTLQWLAYDLEHSCTLNGCVSNSYPHNKLLPIASNHVVCFTLPRSIQHAVYYKCSLSFRLLKRSQLQVIVFRETKQFLLWKSKFWNLKWCCSWY